MPQAEEEGQERQAARQAEQQYREGLVPQSEEEDQEGKSLGRLNRTTGSFSCRRLWRWTRRFRRWTSRVRLLGRLSSTTGRSVVPIL